MTGTLSKAEHKKGTLGSLASGVLGGTLSLTVSTVIVKLLGVIYKIPLARLLGDEGMGYFNSAYTVYAFFYLLCTAGVPKAVMILVSEAKARGSGINERSILRLAMGTFFALGAVITGAFMFLSEPLAELIGNKSSTATMIAIAPSIIFISLAGVVRGYLSANLKLTGIAISQILEGVGKLVFGLIFASFGVRRGLPLSAVSALTILGVTIGAIFGLLYLFFASRDLEISKISKQKLTKTDKKYIKKRIFAISVPITVSAAVMSITNIIDLGLIMRRLIEQGYTELEAASLYGNYTTLAVPMFNLVISLVSPISIAFLPLLTRASALGDKPGFSNTYKSTVTFTAFVSAPLMIGIMTYAREILTLLFGESGVDTGATLLCLLAPALFFATMLLAVNSALEARGAVKAPVISMAVGSIVKIIVSYFLLGDEAFGISGAPIGTVASYAVALTVSLIMAHKRGIANTRILSTYLPPLVNSLVAIIGSRIVFDTLMKNLHPTLSLGIAIALSVIIYLFLTLFLGVFRKSNIRGLCESGKI